MKSNHYKLFLWSITSALAGFLFGFDTVVISGAEQNIQTIWGLSGFMHGLCMSAALWGTVLGAMFGGWPTERLGRRITLLAIGVLFFISAVASGLASNEFLFMIARFIGGVGVGASTVAAPMFISEISPANSRGKLTGLFQFNIVFGILVAFLSNYLIGKHMDSAIAWRWMLGIEALPALVYTVLAFTLPESPRWLIAHAKKRDEGIKVFKKINPDFSNDQINRLVSEVETSVSETKSDAKFWTSRLRLPIALAFLIAFFNQFSGINIILYFAPRLLGLAGIQNALAASASLGVTNLIFTFVGLWLIDKLGRRSLLYIGSLGYIISLGVCAFAFLTTPVFTTFSAADDLLNSAARVKAVQDGTIYFSEADKKSIILTYQQKKQAITEATKIEEFSGEQVTIPDDASLDQVTEIAASTKAHASKDLGMTSYIVLICLMSFIAAHAVGQGAVIWVFISEIFPNEHRATGQALGCSTHWVCAAGLTLMFPIAMRYLAPGVLFAFFCFMMCLQLIWVITMVPETKGITLEEMQHKLGINN